MVLKERSFDRKRTIIQGKRSAHNYARYVKGGRVLIQKLLMGRDINVFRFVNLLILLINSLVTLFFSVKCNVYLCVSVKEHPHDNCRQPDEGGKALTSCWNLWHNSVYHIPKPNIHDKPNATGVVEDLDDNMIVETADTTPTSTDNSNSSSALRLPERTPSQRTRSQRTPSKRTRN